MMAMLGLKIAKAGKLMAGVVARGWEVCARRAPGILKED
jgi:hypothetical protein